MGRECELPLYAGADAQRVALRQSARLPGHRISQGPGDRGSSRWQERRNEQGFDKQPAPRRHFSSPAVAERSPLPVPANSRLRTVPFEKDNVVTIWGTRGVSTIIVLGEDEKIATVALGDTVGWQAVPDQSKQFLFIKPLEPNAVTNMTVVTTRKRIYSFILRTSSGHDRRVVFKVRFTYPDEEADARLLEKARELAAFPNKRNAERSSVRNFDYSYKGAPTSNPSTSSTTGRRPIFGSQATFLEFSWSIRIGRKRSSTIGVRAR